MHFFYNSKTCVYSDNYIATHFPNCVYVSKHQFVFYLHRLEVNVEILNILVAANFTRKLYIMK